jgi:putative tricarboxylic transport membrane protein
MWTPTDRSGDLVIAGILFCIGLVWILESLVMPHGEFSVPGPGFFPTLLGVLLCGVSFLLGARTLFSRTTQPVKIGHLHIWSTIMALMVLAFFFERLGFIITTALFVGFFLKMLSAMRWIPCILLSVAAAISAYLFFDFLLGIPLPSTPWF